MTALITEIAAVHSLTADSRLQYCDGCINADCSLQTCSACAQMVYCSRICQKRMWKFHKPECYLYRKCGRLPTTEIRLLIRLMFSEDLHVRKEINSFVSHKDFFGQNMSFLSYYHGIIKTLTEYLEGGLRLSEPEILTLLCQIKINSFHISSESGSAIAVGIFLKSARLDHSCLSNAEYVFRGKDIVVIPFVKELTVENARISYIDVMTTTAHRRAQLSSSYFFNCDCGLCLNTERDVRIREPICCGSQPLSRPVPSGQLEGDRKYLTACSSDRLARSCPSCRTLYDDCTLKAVEKFCLSFYDKRLGPEDARNAIVIYGRMRDIPEIGGNSLSVKDPLGNHRRDLPAAKYYQLFGHADSVYLANICRAAMSGASVENLNFLLDHLHDGNTIQSSSRLVDRQTLLKVMTASGVDLVNWQQRHLDFNHFDVGMNACSLAGFISRNTSDTVSVCRGTMEEIRLISVSRPADSNLASLFARMVRIAESKLSPFAVHHNGITALLTNLKSTLKSP